MSFFFNSVIKLKNEPSNLHKKQQHNNTKNTIPNSYCIYYCLLCTNTIVSTYLLLLAVVMNNLMPLDMYAAIGGGTSSFQQHQLIQSAPSLRHYDPQPYLESHLIPNCIGHPRIRNPNHRLVRHYVFMCFYCLGSFQLVCGKIYV